MKQDELKLALRGTLIHTPAAGEVEILENALRGLLDGDRRNIKRVWVQGKLIKG